MSSVDIDLKVLKDWLDRETGTDVEIAAPQPPAVQPVFFKAESGAAKHEIQCQLPDS